MRPRCPIAGLDSPSLRILAGLTRAEADYHALDILPAALAELGLDFYPRDSRGGQEPAARALTAQAVSESLTPRELATAIHRHFGHGLPLTERLEAPDDEYDLGVYATMTPEQIDQEVIAEARRLHPANLTSGPRATTRNQPANPSGTVPRTTRRAATRRARLRPPNVAQVQEPGLRYRRLGALGRRVNHCHERTHIVQFCVRGT